MKEKYLQKKINNNNKKIKTHCQKVYLMHKIIHCGIVCDSKQLENKQISTKGGFSE